MALHVFLFLLVFCLILGLARLWHLYWLHHTPPHSRGGAMHTTAQRLRHRHAPHLTAPPVASPAPSRRVWGLRLRLCDLGVR
jgi:hypothetical protein